MNSSDDVDVAYIELLGVTLSGAKRPDQGLYWTDLTGWRGLTPTRGSGDDRPGVDGQFRRGMLLRDRRVMKLTGHILCTSNRELMEVTNRLERALATGAGTMKVVTNTSGEWERFVEIDTLDIDPDHGRRFTKFVVDLVAPDPYRYGPKQTLGPVSLPSYEGGLILPQALPWNRGMVSGGSHLEVFNSGGIRLYPEFTVFDIKTQLQSCSIIETTSGRTLTLARPVAPGQVVRFDTRLRRAFIGTQDVTRFLTSRQWPAVLPGHTEEYRLGATPAETAPLMTVSFQIGEH